MARAALSPAFSGRASAASVGDIDAWLSAARQGDQFVYCEAPQLIRGDGAARAKALADKGLVTTHQVRRAGGGFTFLVMRTGRPIVKKASAAQAVLADPITETIYRSIKRAANFGDRCPSDSELAALVLGTSALDRFTGDGFTRDQAQWRVRKLVDAGLITSRAVTEGGETWRVATILAGEGAGKSTRLPPKAAAFAAAVSREAR